MQAKYALPKTYFHAINLLSQLHINRFR